MTQAVRGRMVGALVLALTCAETTLARDDPPVVDSDLTFVAHVETIYVNVDNDALSAWVKPIFTAIDKQFAAETRRRTVVFEATLHPDRPPEVRLAGQPALSNAETKALKAVAETEETPRSKVVDITFQIVARINGGAPEDAGPLVPPLPTVGQRKLAEFEPASTAARRELLRKWARTEAIPLLGAYARHRIRATDEATRKLGKLLETVKLDGPIDVAALTENNPDYWQAFIEIPKGDPLATALRVALHVANGEISRALHIVEVNVPFEDEGYGSSDLMRDFRWRADLFRKDIETRISKGIELNDAKKFDEATAVFTAVIQDDPDSASAHYERFQTALSRELTADKPTNTAMAQWPAVRKAILTADPLYPHLAVASGPDETYDLLLRKETTTLFKDNDVFGRDIVRYADITLDLGQPGFAAMLYWNARTALKPAAYGDRNLAEDFLYCLEQLGLKDLKSQFRGDHAAEFKRIDADRARRKQEGAGKPVPGAPPR